MVKSVDCISGVDCEGEPLAAPTVDYLYANAVGRRIPQQANLDAVVGAGVELPGVPEVEGGFHLDLLLSVVESTAASSEPFAGD
jgi:hypothetical protein